MLGKSSSLLLRALNSNMSCANRALTKATSLLQLCAQEGDLQRRHAL